MSEFEITQQIAARIWCDPEYSHIAMNPMLAKSIASLLLVEAHMQGKTLVERDPLEDALRTELETEQHFIEHMKLTETKLRAENERLTAERDSALSELATVSTELDNIQRVLDRKNEYDGEKTDAEYLSDLFRRIEENNDEIVDLHAERDRYKAALEKYADGKRWVDGEDDLFAYPDALYIGDTSSNKAECGYDIARAALEEKALRGADDNEVKP